MHFKSDLSIHHDHHAVLSAILERNPLTVTPETPVTEVIRLMSSTSHFQCALTGQAIATNKTSQTESSGRAVLVMSEGKLEGIFTERDLVRLAPVSMSSASQAIGNVASKDFMSLRMSEFDDFFSLVHLMRHHQIQQLPILDDGDQVLGLISLERIRQLLQPSDLLKFRLLKEILVPDVICASPAASLTSVVGQMIEHQVSCIVITEQRQAEPLNKGTSNPGDALHYPVGIITERDILQFQFLELDFEATQAAQVMSTPLFSLGPEESVWQGHQTMQQMRIRRLVIIHESGALAGIITLSQLLQVLDPVEMYSIIELLQSQVQSLQEEKEQLLLDKATALEKEMESHLRVRLLTQAMLSDSEKSYRILAENLPAVVYRIFPHQKNRMVFLNNFVEKLTGFQAEELELGSVCSIDPLIVAEDRPLVISTVQQAIAELKPFSLHYRLINKAGETRYLWEQAQPVMGSDHQLTHYDGVIFDLTERKEIEQALQNERDFNAAILETASALVVVIDPQGHVVRFNTACTKLTGYSLEELQTAPIWETLVPPDELESVQEIFQQLLQGQHPNHHQNHWVDRDGNKHLISWSNTVLTDVNGVVTYVIATGLDKTETQQLEKQFLRVQRLESIGTLASGIAHDLNNILTPILAISQLLPLKIPDLDEQSQQLLDMMKESAKRGAALVNQVLTFSRGLEGDRTNLQLRHIISEIRGIALQTFPKSIEILVDIPRDLWPITGDPTQLHQVFMNLCVNARDAMASGGQLSISGMNLHLDHQFTEKNIEANVGPHILITVSDTGSGISESDLDKIFEPFFTTKAPGKGTGLGLSTVHGIIKNHGGFITVYSEVDKGSQFRVYLPAAETNTELLTVNGDLPRGKGELILLVDDEAPVLMITKEMLEAYNYQVITGSDGIEAIASYAQKPSEIKAVLLDMSMPAMDGMTAIKTLQKINPEVKLILTSGLASNETLAHTLGDGVKAFIAKPFSHSTLLNTLHQVLSNPNSKQSM